MRAVALSTVVLTLLLLLLGGRPCAADDATPLHRAVAEGTVSLEATALGGSSGDTIELLVRRLSAGPLRITLAPGTIFRSKTGRVQDMAGSRVKGEKLGGRAYRPATEIFLSDDAEHRYVAEAYCMDFHKANPAVGDRFALSAPGPGLAALLGAGIAARKSMAVVQAALWIARERVSDAELARRFPVGAGDLAQAHAWLEALRSAPAPAPRGATAFVPPTHPTPPAAEPGPARDPAGRYQWRTTVKAPTGFPPSSDFTIAEVVEGGKHYHKLSGTISDFGGVRLVEVPGLHGVRVEIDPSLGYTTYVGLVFRAAALVDVLDDGTVGTRRAGVEVTDALGRTWRSARTELDGKAVFAFFPPRPAPSLPTPSLAPAPARPVAPSASAGAPPLGSAREFEPEHLVGEPLPSSIDTGTLLFAKGGSIYVPGVLPSGTTLESSVHAGQDVSTPEGRAETVRRVVAMLGAELARSRSVRIFTKAGVYRWPRQR